MKIRASVLTILGLLWAFAIFQTSNNPVAPTVVCSGAIDGAVATAVAAAPAGGVITIGPGSCSFANQVTITNKNVQIVGSGQGVTTIQANNGLTNWVFTGANTPNWRVSGMTINASTPGTLYFRMDATSLDNVSALNGPFRIDHITLDLSGTGGNATCMYFFGMVYGLIDHITITIPGGICIGTGPQVANSTITEDGTLASLFGSTLSHLPYAPGDSHYLYIEDSTLTCTGTDGGHLCAMTDTNYMGCRLVFRHNTVTNGFLYAHWTQSGVVNSCWWEWYNNNFQWNLVALPLYPGRMEGGGNGMMYNNTMNGYADQGILLGEERLGTTNSGPPLGYCDPAGGGPQTWDNNLGDVAAPGWPCYTQAGRQTGPTPAQITAGTKQTSMPFYSWNNGPEDKCRDPALPGAACSNTYQPSSDGVYYIQGTGPGGAGHNVTGGGMGQGDVDVCKTASQPAGCGTHTLTYTAFTYPYPINGQGMPVP